MQKKHTPDKSCYWTLTCAMKKIGRSIFDRHTYNGEINPVLLAKREILAEVMDSTEQQQQLWMTKMPRKRLEKYLRQWDKTKKHFFPKNAGTRWISKFIIHAIASTQLKNWSKISTHSTKSGYLIWSTLTHKCRPGMGMTTITKYKYNIKSGLMTLISEKNDWLRFEFHMHVIRTVCYQ